jgi:hypothetical protein
MVRPDRNRHLTSRPKGFPTLAIGLLTGSRNIGLMLTAVGFAVPDVSWL